MDSWTARKRPWEEDSPIDFQFKRRESTTAAGERHGPPLPQHAGYHSRDSQSLSQRRLPPLYTPACGASAVSVLSTSLRRSPPAQVAAELDTSRPRSRSLFDIFPEPPQPPQDGETERAITFPGTLDLDRSLPPIGTDAHRPRFGIAPAPHAAGGACCSTTCKCQTCLKTQALMHKLAAELILLDTNIKAVLQKEHHSAYESPEVEHIGIHESLQWALDQVQWTNGSLRDQIDTSVSRSPEQGLPQTNSSSTTMRRGQHLPEREERSPRARQYTGSMPGYTSFTHPAVVPTDEGRRHQYGNDHTPLANSPHHTASSSGSMFMAPQSPMQAQPPTRSGMLPSPSSMNFPNVPNLPPISPSTNPLQTSAQAAHLQDLQHQVSIKTLAFQTLQREYDSLLQKLERQRTKCATLEKKFEVSDVEINSLTDEKEKLQSQVTALESQVEELQESRDEARRQLVANGAQYMRIMEMANRLQAQSAEDKRRWETEKSELEQRIRVLEEAMVTGSTEQQSVANVEESTNASPPPSIIEAHHSSSISTLSMSSTETINVLRAEIGRLRTRTQTLEVALQSMREESISIQVAARQLIESGGKMEKVASETTSGQR